MAYCPNGYGNLLSSNNLSDLDSSADARQNLGISQRGIAFGGASPGNGSDYVSHMPYAGVINSVQDLQTSSGTITVNIKINGVDVVGLSSIAVSSTPSDHTATSSNTFGVGDEIRITYSSDSSAVDVRGTIIITQ